MSDLMVQGVDRCEVVGNAVPEIESAGRETTRGVDLVVQTLQAQFGTAEPEVIRNEVAAEFATYSAAPVRDFIPILVESRVRTRLLRAGVGRAGKTR